jgi:sulfoxide reductase heme-binding subunit YedZ
MSGRSLGLIKALCAVACLVPLCLLLLRGFGVDDLGLGANPIQEVLHALGKTGLNLILITLAVTPARRLTGLNWLVRLRRMLGLFAFFYLVLHMLTYVVLDQRLAWGSLLVDVTKRPYITIGFTALVLMIPLAVTSTNAMQRRLGRKWKRLHRLIYPIAVLGLIHFYWQMKSKSAVTEPLIYAAILTLLLGFRVVDWLIKRRRRLSRS